MLSSFWVRLPGWERSAVSTFSITCSIVLMPLSVVETSGWFQTQRSAHSAGVLFVGILFHWSCMVFGGLMASFPPAIGSMTTIARPFSAAYFRPRVPAW